MTKFTLRIVLSVIILIVLIVLFIVYYKPILQGASKLADYIRNQKWGFLIIVGLAFLLSFPPGLGYGMTIIMSGFVYGFPMGIFPHLTGAFLGAVSCFTVFRYFGCAGYVDQKIQKDDKYKAIAEALTEGGFSLLLLVRLCPLPFGVCNAIFSGISHITFWEFSLATFLSLWKNLFTIWIASRLQRLDDQTMDTTAKRANYIFIIVGGSLLIGLSIYMYRATMKRVKEISDKKRGPDLEMQDENEEDIGLVRADTLEEPEKEEDSR